MTRLFSHGCWLFDDVMIRVVMVVVMVVWIVPIWLACTRHADDAHAHASRTAAGVSEPLHPRGAVPVVRVPVVGRDLAQVRRSV
jgi:uncharacterized membrane protein